MRYAEIRSQLKTGDVLLFSGQGAISEGIKFFTISKWSHVGLVYRFDGPLDPEGSIFCWESTTLSDLKDAEMIVVEGTLYPLLTRQKNQGLLTYRWEESPQGPPRKYYSLTEQGRDYLKELHQSWDELVEQIKTIRNK